ncbi:metallophosphoesterase family protein [Ochrobactrum chromiisoli]|uniref:Metallophosphoesterase n=1 Tax=Ochrobactrum chromiisoli TaxID=2993941 RepID=A0ABT3QQM6_9HYPH|nr:metallophosphoesterase [Ochrobactrum chromiisoli]MCX2697891.1 metallophosphoesterase [Ochrobactrum chromiisoli]
MRIIQITDTHLSPTKPHFNSNWLPLVNWIADQKPDLIIHTGDFTVDGADIEEDLAFCRELIADLPAPILCLPGNHDIGHLPASRQPVNAQRLQRWRAHFGPDYWARDFGQWRLIGLNSLILGDGSTDEEQQFLWLEQQLSESGGRPAAVFAHKPLFVDALDEGNTGLWGVPPRPRQRLADLFADYNVKLHASGHLHRAWSGQANGTNYVWAPSAGFVAHAINRELPGERIIGAVVHNLDDTVRSEIVEVDTLIHYVIDDVMHEVYPHNLNGNKT